MKTFIRYICCLLIYSVNSLLNAHIIADEKNALHNDVTDQVREFSHEGIDFNIFYTTDSSSINRVTVSDIDDIQDYIIESYDGLVNQMGFRSPWQSILPNYDFVVKDDWWYAEHSHIVLHSGGGPGSEYPNNGIRNYNAQEMGVVTLHELFHNVQRNYMSSVTSAGSGTYIGTTWGKLVAEGTADVMQDKAVADFDSGAGYPFYDGSAENFLSSPDESLFSKDYDGCLWWNYLMEQLGANKAFEPYYGSEFMREFWNQIVSDASTSEANAKVTMENLIESRGRTLESIFHDFVICNYTREFAIMGIENQERYYYVDEQDNPLANVEKTTTTTKGFNSTEIDSWAAHYIEAEVTSRDECLAVGFKASCSSDKIAIAVVAVDESNAIIGIKKVRGNEGAGVFFSEPTRPIAKLCGIIAALEEPVTVDWEFDEGTPIIDLLRPTFTRPAYPGEYNDPGNLVITAKVTGLPAISPDGPDNPSILGLDKEYFNVSIGGIDANVIDASYVGGLWDILVEAPVQPANGPYDVTVALCGITDINISALFYGDMTFHHAVVLDISGSMEYPDSQKLVAAKKAANFYIDSISNNDKFTVVTFSGDGSEINSDADNLRPSGGLFPGNDVSRIFMKAAVNYQTSENFTSIGDGLWVAQDALDLASDPSAIDTILLLTDGQENESYYWDKDPDGYGTTVKPRILSSKTIVNTRAFGNYAETDLCQEIAMATDGDYLFNPTDSSASTSSLRVARSLSSNSAYTHMPSITNPNEIEDAQNRLVLQFLSGLEHSKQLNRVGLGKGDFAPYGTKALSLEQSHNLVEEPILYVGWSGNSKFDLTLTDPNGIDMETYSDVYTDTNHIIYHPSTIIVKGDYSFRLTETSGNSTELFYGISGKPSNDLEFSISLSPIKNGGAAARRSSGREIFEHGMPVDVNVSATDSKGRIKELNITFTVKMPDGNYACPTYFTLKDDGANYDGNEGDGRYGFRYTRTPYASSYPSARRDEVSKNSSTLNAGGTYIITFYVDGYDNLGSRFQRTFEKAFQVYQRESQYGSQEELYSDYDNDGIPDTWEIFYGTDRDYNDSLVDYDNDGLTNREEFLYGTNPYDPDTDNGGTVDSYEINNALCPLCDSDDPFPNLASVSVISTTDAHGNDAMLMPEALLLQFPDNPGYHSMEIFRDTVPDFQCNNRTLIANVDMGGSDLVTNYYDENLADGVTYYYRLRAANANAEMLTPLSRVISGTARLDPVEPFGTIDICGHQNKTDRRDLAIKLSSPSDGYYRLSDKRLTPSDSWIPLNLNSPGSIINYTVTDPLINDQDTIKIYYEFKSASGVLSRSYHKEIILDLSSDNDLDGIVDSVDTDDDNDGVLDIEELFTYGSNQYLRDSDYDGYRDAAEFSYGTDLLDSESKPDRDGDGYDYMLEKYYNSSDQDANQVPDLGLEIIINDGYANVSFNTVSGVVYRIHERSDLLHRVRDWNRLSGLITGDGTRQTHQVLELSDENFYGVSFDLAPNN